MKKFILITLSIAVILCLIYVCIVINIMLNPYPDLSKNWIKHSDKITLLKIPPKILNDEIFTLGHHIKKYSILSNISEDSLKSLQWSIEMEYNSNKISYRVDDSSYVIFSECKVNLNFDSISNPQLQIKKYFDILTKFYGNNYIIYEYFSENDNDNSKTVYLQWKLENNEVFFSYDIYKVKHKINSNLNIRFSLNSDLYSHKHNYLKLSSKYHSPDLPF